MQTPAQIHRQIITLANLNRVALRSYAARGPRRRYAVFFEELFRLPGGSLRAASVQPRMYIPSADAARYPQLARRSEEHTSELQSPVHLVCRLLLEKKNKKTK